MSGLDLSPAVLAAIDGLASACDRNGYHRGEVPEYRTETEDARSALETAIRSEVKAARAAVIKVDAGYPARRVTLAEADRDPATRGPLSDGVSEAARGGSGASDIGASDYNTSPPSIAPLRGRAEALLAVADKATPGPWHNGDTLWGCGTTKADGFGEVIYTCAGPAERARADAAAIAALRDAPALIRDLLAALGDNLPTKET